MIAEFISFVSQIDKTILVLIIGALTVIGTLVTFHRDSSKSFDLTDLLMENGHVSKISVGYMALLTFSIWLMMRLTITDKMTEGYFTIFCATWVAPIIARIIKGDSSYKQPDPEKKDE